MAIHIGRRNFITLLGGAAAPRAPPKCFGKDWRTPLRRRLQSALPDGRIDGPGLVTILRAALNQKFFKDPI
jgi:hypothetical protein